MRQTLVFSFLLISIVAKTQVVDSLYGVYNNSALEEDERFNALNDVAWEYIYDASDSM